MERPAKMRDQSTSPRVHARSGGEPTQRSDASLHYDPAGDDDLSFAVDTTDPLGFSTDIKTEGALDGISQEEYHCSYQLEQESDRSANLNKPADVALVYEGRNALLNPVLLHVSPDLRQQKSITEFLDEIEQEDTFSIVQQPPVIDVENSASQSQLAANPPLSPRNKNANLCEHQNCGKSFKTVEELGEHRLKEHLHSFGCEICNAHFIDIHGLLQHEQSHHVNGAFICPFCSIELNLRSLLLEHIKGKHPNPPKLYACPKVLCGLLFGDMKNLLAHKMRNKHFQATVISTTKEQDRVRKCCGQVFESYAQYKIHLESEHQGVNVNVRSNLRDIRPGASPASTNVVGAIASSEVPVSDDEAAENAAVLNKTPRCSICNLDFMTLVGLSNHEKKHHKAKHSCTICQAQFKDDAELNCHKKEKHNTNNSSKNKISVINQPRNSDCPDCRNKDPSDDPKDSCWYCSEMQSSDNSQTGEPGSPSATSRRKIQSLDNKTSNNTDSALDRPFSIENSAISNANAIIGRDQGEISKLQYWFSINPTPTDDQVRFYTRQINHFKADGDYHLTEDHVRNWFKSALGMSRVSKNFTPPQIMPGVQIRLVDTPPPPYSSPNDIGVELQKQFPTSGGHVSVNRAHSQGLVSRDSVIQSRTNQDMNSSTNASSDGNAYRNLLLLNKNSQLNTGTANSLKSTCPEALSYPVQQPRPNPNQCETPTFANSGAGRQSQEYPIIPQEQRIQTTQSFLARDMDSNNQNVNSANKSVSVGINQSGRPMVTGVIPSGNLRSLLNSGNSPQVAQTLLQTQTMPNLTQSDCSIIPISTSATNSAFQNNMYHQSFSGNATQQRFLSMTDPRHPHPVPHHVSAKRVPDANIMQQQHQQQQFPQQQRHQPQQQLHQPQRQLHQQQQQLHQPQRQLHQLQQQLHQQQEHQPQQQPLFLDGYLRQYRSPRPNSQLPLPCAQRQPTLAPGPHSRLPISVSIVNPSGGFTQPIFSIDGAAASMTSSPNLNYPQGVNAVRYVPPINHSQPSLLSNSNQVGDFTSSTAPVNPHPTRGDLLHPIEEVSRLLLWSRENIQPSPEMIKMYTDKLNSLPYRSKVPKLSYNTIGAWFRYIQTSVKRVESGLGGSGQETQVSPNTLGLLNQNSELQQYISPAQIPSNSATIQLLDLGSNDQSCSASRQPRTAMNVPITDSHTLSPVPRSIEYISNSILGENDQCNRVSSSQSPTSNIEGNISPDEVPILLTWYKSNTNPGQDEFRKLAYSLNRSEKRKGGPFLSDVAIGKFFDKLLSLRNKVQNIRTAGGAETLKQTSSEPGIIMRQFGNDLKQDSSNDGPVIVSTESISTNSAGGIDSHSLENIDVSPMEVDDDLEIVHENLAPKSNLALDSTKEIQNKNSMCTNGEDVLQAGESVAPNQPESFPEVVKDDNAVHRQVMDLLEGKPSHTALRAILDIFREHTDIIQNYGTLYSEFLENLKQDDLKLTKIANLAASHEKEDTLADNGETCDDLEIVERSPPDIDEVTEMPQLELWYALNPNPDKNCILLCTHQLNEMSYRKNQQNLRILPEDVEQWFICRRNKRADSVVSDSAPAINVSSPEEIAPSPKVSRKYKYSYKYRNRKGKKVLFRPKQACKTTGCGRQFITLAHLKRHQHFAHDKVHCSCPVCDKPFYGRKHLGRHLKHHHKKDRIYLCQSCGQTFATQASIRIHTSTHTNELHLKCKDCGKVFKESETLRMHSMCHLPVMCYMCGVTLKNEAALLSHLENHDDNSEELESSNIISISSAPSQPELDHPNISTQEVAMVESEFEPTTTSPSPPEIGACISTVVEPETIPAPITNLSQLETGPNISLTGMVEQNVVPTHPPESELGIGLQEAVVAEDAPITNLSQLETGPNISLTGTVEQNVVPTHPPESELGIGLQEAVVAEGAPILDSQPEPGTTIGSETVVKHGITTRSKTRTTRRTYHR